VIINFRLALGDSIQDTLLYLHSIADSKHLKIIPYGETNRDPTPAADIKSEGFHTLTDIIQSVFPNTIIAPSIMIAGTDSRYYLTLTHNIFRFYPLILEKHDIESIHGRDERIAMDSFLKSIYFYEQLFLKSDFLS